MVESHDYVVPTYRTITMTANLDATNWLLSKNRAEELGADVWEYFVIPPYYDRLSLSESTKPRVIIGGRGCGKTMLLRYLSHQSTFSTKRSHIPQSEIRHIGLYWKMDTQFCKSLCDREVPPDVWSAAFNHLCAVTLAVELLQSLHSIAASEYPAVTHDTLTAIDLSRLSAFDDTLPTSPKALHKHLEEYLWQFETWANDVRSIKQPRFLPGMKFLLAIISILRKEVEKFEDAQFFIYIDEYENLNADQQRTINTWIKHSSPPLVFNIAMKPNSFENRETNGRELLSPIHDYREVNLDSLGDPCFPEFAAEVLFLQMSNAGVESPIDPNILRDRNKLQLRKTATHLKAVTNDAKRLLPGLSEAELALQVFHDKKLRDHLVMLVAVQLKRRESSLKPLLFVRERTAQASIIVPALLARKRITPDEILQELEQMESGAANKFTGSTNWIHNNFVGCLLQLYTFFGRCCPLYAGFETFCTLAHGNLRHFLELTHRSFQEVENTRHRSITTVPVERQAQAARSASAELLRGIKTFGGEGNRLHTFVLRLGSLFALSQRRVSQSEPERTHFSITRGYEDLNEDDQRFLNEAIRWSVLFEESETKKKVTGIEPEVTEFVLNPIYSPYFAISYRKKRKLDLTTAEASCLIRGNYGDVSALLKKYAKKWDVDIAAETRTLFAHFEDDAV